MRQGPTTGPVRGQDAPTGPLPLGGGEADAPTGALAATPAAILPLADLHDSTITPPRRRTLWARLTGALYGTWGRRARD